MNDTTLDQVSAGGGSDAPAITIPITVDFNPVNNYGNGVKTYDVLQVKAELFATDKHIKIGETVQILSHRILQKNEVWVRLVFLLQENTIKKLEKYRKGTMPLKLAIQVQVGFHDVILIHNTEGKQEEKRFISSVDTGQGEISFHIEQSAWVKNILPKIGHKRYTLVELPAASEVIPEEYSISLKELDQALKYFDAGDYDKSVSHCRAALEPLKDPANIVKYKAYINSNSELDWAKKTLTATDEWLDKLIKATSGFSSKTHHAPSTGHFDRSEAQIIMLVTTGIIAYAGKVGFIQP